MRRITQAELARDIELAIWLATREGGIEVETDNGGIVALEPFPELCTMTATLAEWRRDCEGA